jgi:hypothetical protein
MKDENNNVVQSYLELIAPRVDKADIGVFMDFDECAVTSHMARQVTEYYEKKHPEINIEQFKSDTSFNGVLRLFDVYKGDSYTEFLEFIKELSKTIEWRPGFEKFWRVVYNNPRIQPFWVSSGLYDAIFQKFIVSGLPIREDIIIADTLDIINDRIIDAKMTICEEEKLHAVEFFRQRKSFNRIVTVGHSSGDKHLVAAGDPGYRVAFRDKGALLGIADVIIEDWNWEKILPYLE